MKKIIVASVIIASMSTASFAADLSQKKTEFIRRYRAMIVALLENQKLARELKLEWDANNYSVTMVDADFINDNSHLTAADMGNAVNTVQTITSLLSANGNAHNTNLYKTVR